MYKAGLIAFLFFSLCFATQFHDTDPPLVHDFAVTPVNSDAWVEIKTDTTSRIQLISISQNSGSYFRFGFTADSSDPSGDGSFVVAPTGLGQTQFSMPAGSDLFLKAIDADASTGELYLNLHKEPVISSQ